MRAVRLFLLVCVSVLGCCGAALAAAGPIIGIPEPPFGKTTTHTMYSDCETYKYDYGTGEQCYKIGADGPYTHYVDPADPNATDTDNTMGTVEKPRVTLPSNFVRLPAGSVVEIHGGPFGTTSSFGFTSSGTAQRPIFIRGPSTSPALFQVYASNSNVFRFYGNFYILENLKIDLMNSVKAAVRFGLTDGAVDSIAFRNNEVYNSAPGGNPIVRIIHEHNNANMITNLVFINNTFHDLGQARTTLEKGDTVAISIDQNVANVWILDNKFYRIGGDGVQVATDTPDAAAIMPHHIYIGRNEFYDNFENAVDLKMVHDVIISQNTAHDFGPLYCSNCDSDAHPFRYGSGEGNPGDQRHNIWTIFNLVYNSSGPDGAYLSYAAETQTYPTDIYYIGNIAYNIHSAEGSATAFGSWNQEKIHWVNNVAYNVDRIGNFMGDRFGTYPNEKLVLSNNVFGDIHPDSTVSQHFYLSGIPDSLARADMSNNLFYRSNGVFNFRWGDYAADGSGKVAWSSYTYDRFSAAHPEKLTGSLAANPKFVDPMNGDFYLNPDSPAVDTGKAYDYADIFYQRYGIRLDLSPYALTTDTIGNPIYGLPDIGAIEYQPPYVMGTDKPDLAANVRIYGDGKFRNTQTPSGTVADLAIIPASDNTRQYLDVVISSWSNSGTRHKAWTESSSSITGSVTHTVGDLDTETDYFVSIDTITGSSISGANGTLCSSGICRSDALGRLSFTYSGAYSSHTFDVEKMTFQKLDVNLTGTGGGTVTSAPQGINPVGISCTSGSCSSLFSPDSEVVLTPSADNISTFGSWGGDCSGSGACTVTMNAAKSVSASFELAPKAKIGAVPYTSLYEAYSAAVSGDTIMTIDSELPDSGLDINAALGQGKSITISGGWKADYSDRSELFTYLKGTLKISSGRLAVDGLKLR